MRWLSLILALLCAPAVRADPSDPMEIFGRAFELMEEAGDDTDPVYRHLHGAVRLARTLDRPVADWGFVYAIFSDFLRNDRQTPAYALRIAEEGIALIAPHAGNDNGVSSLLQTSRAYALADLGRLDEADQAARIAEPAFRQHLGDELADDLLAKAAEWRAGRLVADNTPAAELARGVLDRADAALNAGDNAGAIVLAARAVLTEAPGLDPAEVRRINAESGMITGYALMRLGRADEAFAVLRRAAGLMLAPGWEEGAAPVWRQDTAGRDERYWRLFFWLARAGLDTGAFWLVLPALDIAATLDPSPFAQQSVLYARSNHWLGLGDEAKAIADLDTVAEQAAARGDRDGAVLAAYYRETLRAALAQGEGGHDPAPLIAATEAVLEQARVSDMLDPVFIQSETASLLLEGPRMDLALGYARAGLAQATREGAPADGIAAERQQRQIRSLTESFLRAAEAQDARLPGAICPTDPGMGCAVIQTRTPPEIRP